MILGIQSQKGGVGKSVLAVLIACYYSIIKKARVIVVDTDAPQHTVECFARSRAVNDYGRMPFRVTKMNHEGIQDELKALEELYDLVIVDCPGHVNPLLAKQIMNVSGFTLMPTGPSDGDIEAIDAIVDIKDEVEENKYAALIGLIPDKEERKRRARVNAAIVFSRVRPNTNTFKVNYPALCANGRGIPVLQSYLRETEFLGRLIGMGLGPDETTSKHYGYDNDAKGKAQTDIRGICEEIERAEADYMKYLNERLSVDAAEKPLGVN